MDPRELVTSKSYAADNTPEAIPLVNPMAATYGAQNDPSSTSSSQLAPPPATNKSNTLMGRSGKYDRLQQQTEEEEALDDSHTQNEERTR